MTSFHISMSARASNEKTVHIRNPPWSQVAAWLQRVYETGGNVSFTIEDGPELNGLRRCSMRSDVGRYLLTAVLWDGGVESVVSLQDAEGSPERGKVDILGDEWDARLIQEDVDIARIVFRQVLETGKLSKELRQHMR